MRYCMAELCLVLVRDVPVILEFDDQHIFAAGQADEEIRVERSLLRVVALPPSERDLVEARVRRLDPALNAFGDVRLEQACNEPSLGFMSSQHHVDRRLEPIEVVNPPRRPLRIRRVVINKLSKRPRINVKRHGVREAESKKTVASRPKELSAT